MTWSRPTGPNAEALAVALVACGARDRRRRSRRRASTRRAAPRSEPASAAARCVPRERGEGAPRRASPPGERGGGGSPEGRQIHSALPRGRDRLRVAGVGVPHDSGSGVRGENPPEAPVGGVRPVSHSDHSGVDGVADPDAATVVDRDPRRAARRLFRRGFKIGQARSRRSANPLGLRLGDAAKERRKVIAAMTLGARTFAGGRRSLKRRPRAPSRHIQTASSRGDPGKGPDAQRA